MWLDALGRTGKGTDLRALLYVLAPLVCGGRYGVCFASLPLHVCCKQRREHLKSCAGCCVLHSLFSQDKLDLVRAVHVPPTPRARRDARPAASRGASRLAPSATPSATIAQHGGGARGGACVGGAAA